MSGVRAVTTFPPGAWSVYAKIALQSMVKNWPGSIRAYVEGRAPPSLDGVEFRPFDIPERQAFLDSVTPEKKGFLWDAKRFCHKVFAQLDMVKDGEPFWWIDADVVVFREVPEGLLRQDDVVTFFGRDTYTETGLVGFNPTHPGFAEFEDRYRAMYTEGELFNLDCWTDCHAFDAARQGKGKNLTPEGQGFDNVIRDTAFGAYVAHFKGAKKTEIYRLGGADAVSASI